MVVGFSTFIHTGRFFGSPGGVFVAVVVVAAASGFCWVAFGFFDFFFFFLCGAFGIPFSPGVSWDERLVDGSTLEGPVVFGLTGIFFEPGFTELSIIPLITFSMHCSILAFSPPEVNCIVTVDDLSIVFDFAASFGFFKLLASTFGFSGFAELHSAHGWLRFFSVRTSIFSS